MFMRKFSCFLQNFCFSSLGVGNSWHEILSMYMLRSFWNIVWPKLHPFSRWRFLSACKMYMRDRLEPLLAKHRSTPVSQKPLVEWHQDIPRWTPKFQLPTSQSKMLGLPGSHISWSYPSLWMSLHWASRQLTLFPSCRRRTRVRKGTVQSMIWWMSNSGRLLRTLLPRRNSSRVERVGRSRLPVKLPPQWGTAWRRETFLACRTGLSHIGLGSFVVSTYLHTALSKGLAWPKGGSVQHCTEQVQLV